MKRFLIVIAATAVAAAVTIPAVADSGSGSGSGTDPEATFVNCMRTNGVDIPADARGIAIKQWVGAHESQPSVADALKKCAPAARIGDGNGPRELVACLKSKGLNPPTAPDQLKQWLGSQDASVVKSCGVEMRKDDHSGADIADCLRKNGADVPAGLDGMALKNWIADHQDDPAVADALKKCQMDKPDCGAGDVKPAAPAKPDATVTPEIAQQ